MKSYIYIYENIKKLFDSAVSQTAKYADLCILSSISQFTDYVISDFQ